MDAALHGKRDGRPLPAALLRAVVRARGVARGPLTGVRLSLSDLQIRTLLLDIEGTTTPIAFVYGILFPYARAHAAGYLEREWASPPSCAPRPGPACRSFSACAPATATSTTRPSSACGVSTRSSATDYEIVSH